MKCTVQAGLVLVMILVCQGNLVLFPEDFFAKIHLVICLFSFDSSVLECWHIFLF